MKPWRVSDNFTGEEENFGTEAEAIDYAEKILAGHRSDASCNGEWPVDTDLLRIYKVTHQAQIIERGTTEMGEWVEYGIRQAP